MLQTLRALLLLAIALAAPALAQNGDKPVLPGQNVVLGSYYEVSSSGCVALSAPRVTITQRPQLGKLIVTRTQGTVRVFNPRCAVEAMALPVSQVLYQADKPGVDTMAWEIRYQERRGERHQQRQRIERASARITVQPLPPAPVQPTSPGASSVSPGAASSASPAGARPATAFLRSNTAAKKPSVP
jgi:hypothetical protein